MSADKKKLKDICFNKLYKQALTVCKDNTLEKLYDETRLPISWLRKFRAGQIINPSVNRIEKLLVKMTGKASTEFKNK